jgi:hypothetical protein
MLRRFPLRNLDLLDQIRFRRKCLAISGQGDRTARLIRIYSEANLSRRFIALRGGPDAFNPPGL